MGSTVHVNGIRRIIEKTLPLHKKIHDDFFAFIYATNHRVFILK